MDVTQPLDTRRLDAAVLPAGLSVEAGLYLAVFAVALGLRLAGLGDAPLNDSEAREALLALRFVNGVPGLALPASPVYFSLTALVFLLLPATEAAARLAPALAGAGLALLPWFFRRDLGRGTALLAAGLLAGSSTLLAASRTVDGVSLTVFSFGLALGLLRVHARSGGGRWLIGAAAALGAALASGPQAVTGLVIVAALAAASAWAGLGPRLDMPAWRDALARERWGVLTALALSAVLAATFGLTFRSGLAALGGSWLTWFQGGGRSILAAPVFLAVYDPFIVVFGAAGVVRALRSDDRASQALALAGLLALVLLAVHPGRSLPMAVWLAAPLAVLAAKSVAAAVRAPAEAGEWPQALTLAGLLLALFIFAAINLARFASQGGLSTTAWPPALSQSPGLWLAGLTALVAGLVTYLFSVTWSRRAAGLGLQLAGAAALLALTASAGWGLTRLRADQPTELWWPHPAARDLSRLAATLGDVSNYSTGLDSGIVVTVQASPDGALAWALRGFRKAVFTASLDASIDSPAVIAPAGLQNPALGSTYVGQDFPVYRLWRPDNLFPAEQAGWLLTRSAPVEQETVVLWVRQDIQQPRSPQAP